MAVTTLLAPTPRQRKVAAAKAAAGDWRDVTSGFAAGQLQRRGIAPAQQISDNALKHKVTVGTCILSFGHSDHAFSPD